MLLCYLHSVHLAGYARDSANLHTEVPTKSLAVSTGQLFLNTWE